MYSVCKHLEKCNLSILAKLNTTEEADSRKPQRPHCCSDRVVLIYCRSEAPYTPFHSHSFAEGSNDAWCYDIIHVMQRVSEWFSKLKSSWMSSLSTCMSTFPSHCQGSNKCTCWGKCYASVPSHKQSWRYFQINTSALMHYFPLSRLRWELTFSIVSSCTFPI